MADESRLLKFICTFLRFLPDVQRANQLIPSHQKVIYTAISLFIFLAGNQLPLYGIQPATRADPLYWVRLVLASNRDTLMTLGITPILVPEIMMQLLVGSKIIDVDNSVPEARMLLNGAQKLLGILTTIVAAILYVLESGTVGKLVTGNSVLVMLQIFFSGIVVIYLDDVLKKGYGLLSSISLFTATNICASVLWKAFSPNYVIYREKGSQFEGAVIALVHLLITRTDKLYAMHEAFYRENLPNVIDLLATCLFFVIAIFFQGFSVVLPVRTHDLPGVQVNCPIKLSSISYGPVILQRALMSYLYVISELLYMNYDDNKLVNLLGKWKGYKHFGQSIPVGGIVYYLTAPPTLADLQRDPLHAFLYVVFVLSTCSLLSVTWFRVCVTSKRFLAGLVRANEQRRLMLAQSDSIPPNEFESYIAKTACLGGFCVGALIVLADLIGVIGSGNGIMLAVSAVYPYFEGRASELCIEGGSALGACQEDNGAWHGWDCSGGQSAAVKGGGDGDLELRVAAVKSN